MGKIGVDDRVLKKPGKLTDEEFEMMKQHTVKGANIMRPVAQLKDMLPGIELHHERMDGAGYPYGLQGDPDSADGAHDRRRGHARRHHHQSALPVRHGPELRHASASKRSPSRASIPRSSTLSQLPFATAACASAPPSSKSNLADCPEADTLISRRFVPPYHGRRARAYRRHFSVGARHGVPGADP